MRALLVLFSLVLSLSTAQAADKLQVVTSFSILDDITHQIGGDHIQISNMVGPDADAHTYEPTPDDAKALLKAKVIIKNGLGSSRGWTAWLPAPKPRQRWSPPAKA